MSWESRQNYIFFRYYGYDHHVIFDNELKDFTNELSEDGYGETGGLGKVWTHLE